jgi:hypothetical protein
MRKRTLSHKTSRILMNEQTFWCYVASITVHNTTWNSVFPSVSWTSARRNRSAHILMVFSRLLLSIHLNMRFHVHSPDCFRTRANKQIIHRRPNSDRSMRTADGAKSAFRCLKDGETQKNHMPIQAKLWARPLSSLSSPVCGESITTTNSKAEGKQNSSKPNAREPK